MIAPWLQDLLYQEWDWRVALRHIARDLPGVAGPRPEGLCAVARALEHVEPDRRFAVATYRQAGPEADGGRALELAVELGWWEEVVALGAAARSAVGSLQALLSEGWALVELGQQGRAQRLVPTRPMDPYLAALRQELDGATESALGAWVERAESTMQAEAAEAYFVAARMSRALGRAQWRQWLLAALRADPGHRWAFSLLLDARWTDARSSVASSLEVLRLRLAGHDDRAQLVQWCDATRAVAMRLWLSQDGAKARAVARRLLVAALERAYRERASEVAGHLAIWATLDDGARGDDTRVELLPLLVAALEAPLPAHDHVYLAALGADICMRAGSAAAARSYAEVVAARAPAHPAAREFFGHASSVPVGGEAELEGFCAALERLELEGEGDLQIEEMVPLDESDPLVLGPGGSSAAIATRAERELSSELATVDELVLGQADGDDAMISELLAAVDTSLSDDSGAATSVARGHGRRTAVQGSFALAASWDPARGRAPRVVPAGREETGRHPATVIGPSALGLRTPALPTRSAALPTRSAPAPARSAPAPAPSAAPAPAPSLARELIPTSAKSALAVNRSSRRMPAVSEPGGPLPQQLTVPPEQEQRHAERRVQPAELRLEVGGREVAMQVRDLSASGLFAVTSEKPAVGALLRCELHVVGDDLQEQVIHAQVRVVRRTPLGIGLSFIDQLPELASVLKR